MAHLPPTFEARLVRARALTPSVRELVFERVDGAPMAFVPGQWVSTVFRAEGGADSGRAEAGGGDEPRQGSEPTTAPAEPDMKRSYSIASSPDGSPRFEIAVTLVPNGPVSTRLHALDPGTVLRFVGPQGFFTRPAEFALPSLMIATGTGVTPMRSMLRAAAAQGSRAPIWLVLGVRHEDDLLYRDEFRSLAGDYPWFRFEPTLSQPLGPWQGRRGYVQTHVRALWDELASLGLGLGAGGDVRPHAYVCGLERMVGTVRDLLRKEMALPRQQVHSERYD
jgi:CDP-4-dehydro-6-deoxyglucose reductase